ncbi:hypothetical protein [Stenotrophomonas maltophilia]|uniref:hypothetical protein n=1 Tax=Stenotrophomonas maltophilia TaxID=40324 RepID=UPI00240E051D|nr:hypothetical protein [Stenotrophomonas maltophilia]MDG2510975.1 hypothetical protein [Stenotrophomonas maltophilia]
MSENIEATRPDIESVTLWDLSGEMGGAEEALPVQEGSLDLREEIASVGGAQELHPKDKARLVMAYWVLGAVLVLMILSSVGYILLSEHTSAAAKEVFDFFKGFGPPLITLVLGFYFRDAFAGSDS